MLLLRVLCGLVFWWLATHALAEEPPLAAASEPAAGHSTQGTALPLDYFSEFDNGLGLGDIASLPDSAWQTLHAQTTGLGFEDRTVWFRTRLAAPGRQGADSPVDKPMLEIGYPLLNHVDLFVRSRPRAPGPQAWRLEQWQMGNKLPYAERPYPDPNFVVPLNVNAGDEVEIYLRVRTHSAMLLPLRLWSASAFVEHSQRKVLAQGGYAGLLLGLTLFNLMLLVLRHERVYLLQALWALGIGTFVLTSNGLAFQYLWPELPGWNDGALLGLLLTSTGFGVALAIDFMQPAFPDSPWCRYGTPAVLLLCLLLIALGCNLPYRNAIAMSMAIALAGLGLNTLLSLGALARGYRPARMFLLSNVCLACGAVWLALNKFGLGPAHEGADLTMQIGSVFNVLVMSLSLGQRQQEQHRTQQIRQQALIQSNQKIRHQLEQHVVERTQRLQQMNEKLSLLSTTDALTGIPNRRYLDSYLKTEVARAAADARPISIAMVDIDCFKQFNDAYGHVAGDKCLRATAQELRRQLPRASDLVARFGGEEFFIVMPQTSADGAMIVCERLRRGMLSLRIDVGGSLVGVTVSIGLFSTVPHDASDVASLVETVDRALYRAKLSGRNQVMPVSGPPQDASAKHQLH